MLARKQKTYTILEDADDTVPVAPSSEKEESRKKKFRKRSEHQDDVDDEVVSHGSKERQVRRRTVHDEDDGSESEEERLRDQREREELERHLRECDAAGTRDDIEDEQYLFEGVKLSEAEYRELRGTQSCPGN